VFFIDFFPRFVYGATRKVCQPIYPETGYSEDGKSAAGPAEGLRDRGCPGSTGYSRQTRGRGISVSGESLRNFFVRIVSSTWNGAKGIRTGNCVGGM
jgi:hypothetical protein